MGFDASSLRIPGVVPFVMNVFDIIGTAFGAVILLGATIGFVGQIVIAFLGKKKQKIDSLEVRQERDKWKRIVLNLLVVIAVLVWILFQKL